MVKTLFEYTQPSSLSCNNEGRIEAMDTRVERINPYIDVKNISNSVKYDVDILGFELYFQSPDFGIIERNGHQIHLTKSKGKIEPGRIWIGVEELESLFEQYRKNGAKITQNPTNYSWAYQMAVEDLDGNQLIIGSAPKIGEAFEDQN